jgi:hypothetical protein
MGETLPGEAGALLQAIGTLLPYANGAAGDVIMPLRKALAALVVTGDHAPTKAATSSLIGAKTASLRPVKRAERASRKTGAIRVGETRVDPGWPALLTRIRNAMAERGAPLNAVAHAAGIPASTARDYLRGGRVPPVATKAALIAWLEAPPAQPKEDAAPPPPTFPGSGRPFRIGATETTARA